MDRTFHQRVSPEIIVGIMMMGIAALFCFWQRDTALAIAGAIVMAADVVAIERTIHTTYVLTGDRLVVGRGRFGKPQTILIGDIVKMERMPTLFGASHYILLQIGANKRIALRPNNEEAFIQEIKKRQQQYEDTP